MSNHPVIGGFGSRPEERGQGQVISLADYAAARATPPDPLPEVERISVACLKADWLLALRVSDGDPWIAYLWATRQLVADMAEHDDPLPALTVVGDAITEELCEVGRRAR